MKQNCKMSSQIYSFETIHFLAPLVLYQLKPKIDKTNNATCIAVIGKALHEKEEKIVKNDKVQRCKN